MLESHDSQRPNFLQVEVHGTIQGGTLSVNIDVALFRKNFSNLEAVSRMTCGVTSSLVNIKGRDERCAMLRALDIAKASGSWSR